MELRQFKTFAVIARQGSFVQAATALGYAQSTVTSHIQALESELGVRLFERLGHRVMLTDQGKAFLPYAEQVLRLVTEAAGAVGADGPQGRLTIGTSESLGTYRLPEMFRHYRQAYPKVELIIRFASCGAVYEGIRHNEVDVGLIINDRLAGEDLVAEDLSAEEMVFLAAPEHPLAAAERVTPVDLAETCVILTEPGCSYRQTVEKILRDSQVCPQAILEASSTEAIKQLIMLGLGISLLPRYAAEKELAAGSLRAIRWHEPVSGYRVQLLYHKDKWLSPAVRAFLEAARVCFRKG